MILLHVANVTHPDLRAHTQKKRNQRQKKKGKEKGEKEKRGKRKKTQREPEKKKKKKAHRPTKPSTGVKKRNRGMPWGT